MAESTIPKSLASDINTLNSSITNLSSLAYVELPTSGEYSDSALYTALKNNNSIVAKRFCFFLAPFTGGARFGMCYLYEGSKDYGMIMVFRYGLAPRFLAVNGGTIRLTNWDS